MCPVPDYMCNTVMTRLIFYGELFLKDVCSTLWVWQRSVETFIGLIGLIGHKYGIYVSKKQ